MSTSLDAMVNPPLLVWAREESGYPPELVADRLKVKAERLLAWERGDLKPTVRQVQLLAKFYHRPFGIFFLPQPPMLPPMAGEYRRLPGVEPGAESPELRLALRVMSQRRRVALQLIEELGNPITEFETSALLSEEPGEVGSRLRVVLGVSDEEQLGWKDEWEGWRRWREAVEAAGILVFQFPKVPLNQVRGLSLLNFPLPVIGINNKESAPSARVFTLLHELTHIALSVGQEEEPALGEGRNAEEWSKVERFAEEAASAALIPANVLAGFLGRMSVARDAWDVPLVRSLAAKFRVTPLAMATRLRVEGALTWEGYDRWKAGWAEYLKNLKPRSGGFASPVDKALGRGGRPLAQLVVEALDANRITAVEACRHLDLRFEHFDKLRAELRDRAGGTHTIDDGE
ncbi:MAG TPA: XRE family transcriptional regulator [Acidobacteriota bacterium]|nr:XRE family transcriptional regulator [Acidobacteriota bacterium]